MTFLDLTTYKKIHWLQGWTKWKKQAQTLLLILIGIGQKALFGGKRNKNSAKSSSVTCLPRIFSYFVTFSAILINPIAALSVIIIINFVNKISAFVVTSSPDNVAQATTEKWKRKLCEIGKWEKLKLWLPEECKRQVELTQQK